MHWLRLTDRRSQGQGLIVISCPALIDLLCFSSLLIVLVLIVREISLRWIPSNRLWNAMLVTDWDWVLLAAYLSVYRSGTVLRMTYTSRCMNTSMNCSPNHSESHAASTTHISHVWPSGVMVRAWDLWLGGHSRATATYQPRESCSHSPASVVNQHNLLAVTGQWDRMAEKVNIGMMLHSPCFTDLNG